MNDGWIEVNLFLKNTRMYIQTSLRAPIDRMVCAARVLRLSCVLLLMSACRSDRLPQPTIDFSTLPPATHGGSERVDTIAGKVAGASTDDQVVVYARSGPWWVQPTSDHSLIPIQQDLSWKTETHLGYEYAALLVNKGYKPAPTLDSLPEVGGSVLALKTAKGVGVLPPPPTVPIRFAGYNWNVDTTSAFRGGVNHLFLKAMSGLIERAHCICKCESPGTDGYARI